MSEKQKKDREAFCQDVKDGKPLPPDHRAKTYAAGLPDRHPVKNLLNSESQRVVAHDSVYAFLSLFSDTYADRIERALADPSFRLLPPPFLARDLEREEEALRTRIVRDVIGDDGRRHRMLRLHADARHAIARMTHGHPVQYAQLLSAFDRTVAALVRAVRLAPPPPRPEGPPDLRLVAR
jgi:hypothetical protein